MDMTDLKYGCNILTMGTEGGYRTYQLKLVQVNDASGESIPISWLASSLMGAPVKVGDILNYSVSCDGADKVNRCCASYAGKGPRKVQYETWGLQLNDGYAVELRSTRLGQLSELGDLERVIAQGVITGKLRWDAIPANLRQFIMDGGYVSWMDTDSHFSDTG